MSSFFGRLWRWLGMAVFIVIIVVCNLAQCASHVTVTRPDAVEHATNSCHIWAQVKAESYRVASDADAATRVMDLVDAFKKETSAVAMDSRYGGLDSDASRLVTALRNEDASEVSATIGSIDGRCSAL